MRVLLAIDGSSCADAATRLVAGLAWPEGTSLLVVAVAEPRPATTAGLAPFPVPVETGRVGLTRGLTAALADAVARLDAPGRWVESRLIHGRAATAIVDQAARHRADVVVVGSRGLGPIGSMVLGSVSAEVVDHAPCAVLVARGGSVDRVLLAVDGSATSRRAVEHVGGLGYLVDKPFEVIAVEPSAPAMTLVPVADVGRERAEAVAAQAAQQLRDDRIASRWSIGVGDPAHEIIRAAHDLGCDLIVVGSRGQTGLTRLLVGSVARKVLMHAGASVLVVREPIRRRADRPDHAHPGVGVVVSALALIAPAPHLAQDT